MLSPARGATVLACAIAVLLTHTAVGDDKPPVVTVTGDTHNGTVSTTVTAPGSPGSSATGSGTGSSSSSHDEVTCTWTEESGYSQQVFQWLGSDPGGTWYDVTCSDGSSYIGVYVPPNSGSVPPAVVLAGALARTVVNRLQLPDPTVGHSPAGAALVGLPTWLWVQPSSWRVLRQRTAAGPVWAEVVATPSSTTWDPGDGAAALVCAGPGTAYDRSRPESVQSTDCSYTYRRSSAGQPQSGPDVNDRYFTVTVTTTWQISWTGPGGSGGTLPAMTRSSTFDLAVAQRQTVVTGGSG